MQCPLLIFVVETGCVVDIAAAVGVAAAAAVVVGGGGGGGGGVGVAVAVVRGHGCSFSTPYDSGGIFIIIIVRVNITVMNF